MKKDFIDVLHMPKALCEATQPRQQLRSKYKTGKKPSKASQHWNQIKFDKDV